MKQRERVFAVPFRWFNLLLAIAFHAVSVELLIECQAN